MNKNNRQFGVFTFILLLIVIALYSSAFTLKEGRQAIIVQFGKPIKTVRYPGLHWKLPFIQDVREVDSRILSWDGYPNQIPTRDKKYIIVDTSARWKVEEPLKFIQTVQNENSGISRINAILSANTRDVISSHNLVEAVRNTNGIFDVINSRKEKVKKLEKAGAIVQAELLEQEEVTGEIEKIKLGREHLSKMITERAKKELRSIGVELIDVQLRRIMYESSVEEKVYTRMISERKKIAEKIRSVGKGEQAKIQGRTSRELQEIQSKAYKTVQSIKGGVDAKATAIYAKSLQKDPKLYEFTRKLEIYKTKLKPNTRLILSSQDEPLKDFLTK